MTFSELTNLLNKSISARDAMERQSFDGAIVYVGIYLLKYLNDKGSKALIGGATRSPAKLPSDACWSSLSDNPTPAAVAKAVNALKNFGPTQQIGEMLTDLGLADAAPLSRFTAAYSVGSVAEIVGQLNETDLSVCSDDDLSRIVDDKLGRAAEISGYRGGEHYTPRGVAKLMASLLDPRPCSRIYDPACGTGTLLLAAHAEAEQTENGEDCHTMLLGQEINSRVAALARINALLHGVSVSDIRTGNTLTDPQFCEATSLSRFDYVISAPPLGLKLSPQDIESLREDAFTRFEIGVSPRAADWAFVQHCLASLDDDGKAVVLVSPACLYAGGKDQEIRSHLLGEDVVEAVITLPADLLPNTSIPVSLLVCNLNKPIESKGKILFIYAADSYEFTENRKRIVEDRHCAQIVNLLRSKESRAGTSVLVDSEEISNREFSFVPARYISLVDMKRFLGGEVHWAVFGDLYDIKQGVRSGSKHVSESGEPIIRGRDLTATPFDPDEFARVDLATSDPVYASIGDLLIQRVGIQPKVRVVSEAIDNVLVAESIFLAHPRQRNDSLSRYISEFLNSGLGQGVLSAHTYGVGAPTLRLRDIRELKIPIPQASVFELLDNIRRVEEQLIDRIGTARDLRQRLFSIEDAGEVESRLRTLGTEAKVLAGSLIRSDDLDYQIRNFYPFPLAYSYRTLSAVGEVAQLYQEQLRVAENVLAYLASIGLALVGFSGALQQNETRSLSPDIIADAWKGGISPGHWQSLAFEAGRVLRNVEGPSIIGEYSGLWFKDRSSKPSEFCQLTKKMVEVKNDFKHDRGPKTVQALAAASAELGDLLTQVFQQLGFLIRYPIRLVEKSDIDWRSGSAIVQSLVYAGDHPGLRREENIRPAAIPTGKLYIEAGDDRWVQLYPILNVLYCPSCQRSETYMIEGLDRRRERISLKSFERGHSLTSDQTDEPLYTNFHHWMTTLSLPSNAE